MLLISCYLIWFNSLFYLCRSSIPEVEVPAIPPVIAGETTPVTAHDTIPLPASADTISAIRGVAEKYVI